MGYRSRTLTHFVPAARAFFRMIHSVNRKDDGVAATELALLAPLLIFSVLAATDLGLAITERMTLGHILRAGAQSATEDVGVTKISQSLRTTAAKNMTVAATGAAGTDTTVALTVRRMCACAAQPSVELACSATCAQKAPTQIYYILSGSKTYSGLLLPRISQTKSLKVQVR